MTQNNEQSITLTPEQLQSLIADATAQAVARVSRVVSPTPATPVIPATKSNVKAKAKKQAYYGVLVAAIFNEGKSIEAAARLSGLTVEEATEYLASKKRLDSTGKLPDPKYRNGKASKARMPVVEAQKILQKNHAGIVTRYGRPRESGRISVAGLGRKYGVTINCMTDYLRKCGFHVTDQDLRD